MNRKAIIFGIKGTRLTNEEKNILKKNKPWGVILFSRNIKNLDQIQNLIIKIKKTVNDTKYPILIDQEGGRISRLNKIIDHSLFTQNYFGKLYRRDKKLFVEQYKNYTNQVCAILKYIGVNINTVPVLDIKSRSGNKIIGDRSFSENVQEVSNIGKICIKFYKNNKIGTVIKHIPGHGSAKNDTHYKSSVINYKKKKLISKDFKPFKFCKSFFAMTAHIIYSKYDPINSVTHSKIIIDKVIRKHIGFRGILISDDISMKALKYGIVKNAILALKAGCNLVLHCNGNIKEMKKLVKIIPRIDKFTQKKTSQFYKYLG